jgi:HTH-type transcriptional regulator, quorum sensing regulator NprR
MMINGSALKAARMNAEWKQTELAKGICAPSMLSLIENGKANPSEKLVDQLAERLDIPVESLLSENA